MADMDGVGGEAGIGGAIGALIGSWVGGNGLGGRGAVAGEAVALEGINNIGMQLLQGQNATNTTIERSAATTYNGLTQQNTQDLLASVQGFAGLNTAITGSTAAIVAAIATNDRNALERSYQAQIEALKCCCETKALIMAEGNATRAQALELRAIEQSEKICDLKSALQESRFFASQLQQTQQITGFVNYKLPTPAVPPTF